MGASGRDASLSLITLLTVLIPEILWSQPIALQPVLSGLTNPVYVTSAHDGSNRLFIVERDGRIEELVRQEVAVRDQATQQRRVINVRLRWLQNSQAFGIVSSSEN